MMIEIRPKRMVNKPSRYQTTSSDEAPVQPPPKKAAAAERIANDVDEIKNILEKDNFNNSNTNTQYSSYHTHIYTHANIPTCTVLTTEYSQDTQHSVRRT